MSRNKFRNSSQEEIADRLAEYGEPENQRDRRFIASRSREISQRNARQDREEERRR